MGRYHTYPEYKDSGVEWIGQIPNHWGRLKFKFTSKEGKAFASGPFGSSIGTQFYRDSGVPVIRGNNLSLNGNKPKFVDDGYVFLDETKADELSNAEVIAGDLVFTARGTVGQVGLVPSQGDFNWSRAILSANQLRFRNHDTGFNSNYLWYLFSSWLIRTQVLLSSDSVAQPNLNLGSLKDLHLLRPVFEEQVSIANFLDHETAKIETLIEQQQQLIQLLKEKRQAVISHAVTKGLNPNAPMKDSGVEWLGEVPAHWGIKRFKFLCDQIIAGPFGSSITKDMYVKDGYKVYGQEQVIPNDFSIGDYYISEKNYLELSRYIARPGDILISCVGTFGKIAVFPKEAEPGIINPRLIKAQINDNCDPYYLRELLKSEMVFKQFELLSRGGTMGVINIAILNEIIASVPPLSEQRDIVVFINEQECKFDHLLDSINKQIEFSQERRTALISAAVTGKIDVRKWQTTQQ